MIEEEKKVVTMGKTIDAFFKFILDDPIMLGLCLAIVVLIVLFIVVLLLGKKADKKEDKNIEKEDALLKTEIDLTKLDESAGASLETIDTEPKVVPTIETPKENDVQEIPVTIEEPTKLEIEKEEQKEPIDNFVLEEGAPSSIPSFDDYKIEVPTAEEIKEITQELEVIDAPKEQQLEEVPSFEVPKLESADVVLPAVSETDSIEALDDLTNAEEPVQEEQNIFDMQEPLGIVESVVNPIEGSVIPASSDGEENNKLENALMNEFNFSTQEVSAPEIEDVPVEEKPIVEEPSMTDIPKVIEPEEKSETIENLYNVKLEEAEKLSEEVESLEDMYTLSEEELPEIKVEDFSRTAIIRHVPILETNTKNILDDKVTDSSSEDLDDLALPKLSSNREDKTVLGSLKGESFDIEK